MKIRQFGFVSALIGATLICIGVIGPCARTVAVAADEPKTATPQVVLADTYNAVTRVYFNNTAVHKGSHKPGLVERRFRADVKYWLMDAKYYDRGELSVGNPPLVDLVRKLGSKNLPSDHAIRDGLRDRTLRSRSVSDHATDRNSADPFLEGPRSRGRSARQPRRQSRFAALSKQQARRKYATARGLSFGGA